MVKVRYIECTLIPVAILIAESQYFVIVLYGGDGSTGGKIYIVRLQFATMTSYFLVVLPYSAPILNRKQSNYRLMRYFLQ